MIARHSCPEDGDPWLFRRSVHRLAADLRQGICSARGLLEHYLARIERLNPQLNALVFLDPSAVAAAEASDERLRAGRPLSSLDGIPIAIKDNLLLRGCPATWGSPLYANHVPNRDELPVARLRQAGAVLIGKTNVPEFALRGYTANSVYGITRNPWDLALTPGGSSGGAVAAVAAGLVPLALATDGGGSIRRPAAHTGVVGLKPSVGRVRRGGGFPELMFDCEVVGPIGRTVADARLMFEVLAQRVATTQRERARILFAERVGIAPVDPQIVESCRKAASQLAALGHTIVDGELPFSTNAALEAWQTVIRTGLALLARKEPRFFDTASPDFIEQSEEGQQLAATDYAEAIETLFDFRVRVAQAFEHIDLIMTPAIAAQPWPAEDPYPPVIAGEAVGPRGHAVYTAWVNACGHPAIALPARPASDDMPIGFQLIAQYGGDEFLLDVAEAFETAHSWAERWPAMAKKTAHNF